MIALISDIHGNYVALKRVLEEIDALGIREIYCLGDIAGYYTQINECCDELRARGVKSVMGNHDWYLAGQGYCLRSKSANECVAYQKKIITQENLDWLASAPVFRRVGDLSLVHGGWGNPIDEYLEISEEYFARLDGKYFASGHRHVPVVADFGEKKYCNPGSVGQPRDGDPRAAFATWDGHDFALHRTAYDFEVVGALMEKAGFNGYYYGCLRTGAAKLGY
jgi:predicted phosphodiesterase